MTPDSTTLKQSAPAGQAVLANPGTLEQAATPMKLKIGVMGGATGDLGREILARAHELGAEIARAGCVLVTGACPGLPLAAACGARALGGLVLGISPGLSLDEHVYKYGSPTEFHDVLVFTGSGLMGREVVNIRSSDIVLIVGGRSGTLGELAIAYDEGKLIGVLTGTGGISDLVPQILSACQKETGARVVYDEDPARLVTETLRVYRTSHHRRPSCFCADQSATAADIRGETVVDPTCGMRIRPADAAESRNRSHTTLFFCSDSCARRFDANPSRGVAATGAG